MAFCLAKWSTGVLHGIFSPLRDLGLTVISVDGREQVRVAQESPDPPRRGFVLRIRSYRCQW